MIRKYSIALIAIGLSCSQWAWASPRNIIFLIGDGMGFEQVRAAGIYANGKAGTLLFENFPYQARVSTYSASSPVTDSAASATAMATEIKVNNKVISTRIPGDGAEIYTLLEYFKDQGKRTGLVTTTYISHATPAAFGAHESSRANYSEIVADYLIQTQPDVLFGGARYISKAAAELAGYTVVTNKTELQDLDTELPVRVSGQFGNHNMPYKYDGMGYETLPDLSEMTMVALAILDDNPDGFFMMVEGGRIDHAGHANNIARNIFETMEFNDTVSTVLSWAKGRSDTLILVTADHETGGLSIINDNGQGMMPDVTWNTAGHTGVDVPAYAIGENAQLVAGHMDNTDFFGLMAFSSFTRVDYYCDEDKDKHLSATISGSCRGTGCEPVSCGLATGNDCDDTSAGVSPDAIEIPGNHVDENCDGQVVCAPYFSRKRTGPYSIYSCAGDSSSGRRRQR